MNSGSQSILQYDLSYIAHRRKQLQEYLDVFAKQMFHICKAMPSPKIKVNLKTGEIESENEAEWESLIDKIQKQQEDFLKKEFPEFYSE